MLHTIPNFPCSFFSSLLPFFLYLSLYLLSLPTCFYLCHPSQPTPVLPGSRLCSQVPRSCPRCWADPTDSLGGLSLGEERDTLYPNAEE